MHAATIVPEGQRLGFLPEVFGSTACVRVESRIFHYADRMIEGYKGGMWDFVRVGDAGYMRPSTNSIDPTAVRGGKLTIRESDLCCWRGMLSFDAAGLALTVLATNHEWHRRPNDTGLGLAWGHLMEVVNYHPERDALLGLLD